MSIEHLDDTWISEDGDDVLGVQVNQDTPRRHSVFVNVMEFVRSEPLESRVRTAIAEAVRAVEGVEVVSEDERETWDVIGETSGDAIIRAVAATLEDLVDELREHAPDEAPELIQPQDVDYRLD